MPDPIAVLGMQLILKGFEPAAINEMCGALRTKLTWKEHVPDETIRVPSIRTYEARFGDWHFVLADFDISEQQGRVPGERGQNIAIANAKRGWSFMSDDAIHHDIGRLLIKQVDTTSDDLLGSGTLRPSTEAEKAAARRRLAEGNLDLRNPHDMRLAVEWQTANIERLNEGGIWGTSWGGMQIFKSRKVVKLLEGRMLTPVRIAFYAMGWTVEEAEIDQNEIAVCKRWASLYQP